MNVKKEHIFYGAFAVGIIALVAVMAVYNNNSENPKIASEQGVDLNASKTTKDETEDMNVMNDDAVAQDLQKEHSDVESPEIAEESGATTDSGDVAGAGELSDDAGDDSAGDSDSDDADDAGSDGSGSDSADNDGADNDSADHNNDGSEDGSDNQDSSDASDSGYAYNGSQTLTWPVMGDVIIPFSMDTTVYFETLEQYKCNPGMLIAATKGTEVASVYAGLVKEIGESNEYGKYLILDLGNGYQVYYGQLQDIQVAEGAHVAAGDFLAGVADPSSYFTKEGSHLYLEITKDDAPVNPVTLMVE